MGKPAQPLPGCSTAELFQQGEQGAQLPSVDRGGLELEAGRQLSFDKNERHAGSDGAEPEGLGDSNGVTERENGRAVTGGNGALRFTPRGAIRSN